METIFFFSEYLGRILKPLLTICY